MYAACGPYMKACRARATVTPRNSASRLPDRVMARNTHTQTAAPIAAAPYTRRRSQDLLDRLGGRLALLGDLLEHGRLLQPGPDPKAERDQHGGEDEGHPPAPR